MQKSNKGLYNLENYFNIPFGKNKPLSIIGGAIPLKSYDKSSGASVSLAYDPFGNHVAQGCFDGSVRIFSPFSGKM